MTHDIDIDNEREDGCPSRLRLSTWHDGEGEPDVGDHVKDCSRCTTVVKQYRDIDAAVSEIPAASPDLIRRIRCACAESERPVFTMVPALRVAAGFLIVLAVAASFLANTRNNTAGNSAAGNTNLGTGADGLGEQTVVVKLGNRIQPLYGPRQINQVQSPSAAGLPNAQLVSSGTSAATLAMQGVPNLPVVLPDQVRHVWVVNNLEQSKTELLDLLPDGTKARVCKGEKNDKTACLTLWLPENQLQVLVNRLADNGWALVSSSFPQPGEAERIIATGREVQYTCDLIAQ